MKNRILLICFCLIFVAFYGCSKSEDNSNEPEINCSTQLETAVQCKAVTTSCDEKLETKVQCSGTTTAKVRCTRETYNSCGYCFQHTSQAPAEIPVACTLMTKNSCGYCDKHKDLAN
jgi:hypothetical protein